jgi:probable F420-dependent oxidoreductase
MTVAPSREVSTTLEGSPWRSALTPPYFSGPGAVEQTIEAAQWAESLGYDDLWLADAGGVDALTLSALVLARTERIRVGIAVVPVYTRTVPVLAATVATLDSVSPGRFALGLGSSSHFMVEGWHGVPFQQPVARVRETVELLRQILSGLKTSYQGEVVHSHGYQQPMAATSVPVHLAALRPRMIDLAAEKAEGIILNLFPRAALPGVFTTIDEALARHGRQRSSIEVATRLSVTVTDDVAAARDAFRRAFIPYYATPSYNAFLSWAGRPDVAEAVRKGWAAKDRAACYEAMEDSLVDEIAISGSAEHCRQRVRELYEAGITTPLMFCLSNDQSVVEATFEAFAPAHFTI